MCKTCETSCVDHFEKLKVGRFSIEIPEESFDEDGKFDICRWLSNRNVRPFPRTEWNWSWNRKKGDSRGLAYDSFIGSLPKRVAKWCAEQKVKLEPKDRTELGNLLAKYYSRKKDYYCDLTNQFDWSSGDFGDHGSCFWQGRKDARFTLQKLADEGKAFALRFFKDETYKAGTSRSWLVRPTQEEQAVILFNAYGYDSKTQSTLLSDYLRLSARSIRLTNQQRCDAILYINSGVGIMIGPEAVVNRYQAVDLQIKIIRTSCDMCGASLNGFQKEVGGYFCCEKCYKERCTKCVLCETDLWRQSAYTFESKEYCANCFCNNFFNCSYCGGVRKIEEKVRNVEGRWPCNICIQGIHTECHDCKRYGLTENGRRLRVNGVSRFFCSECIPNHYWNCSYCGNRKLKRSSVCKHCKQSTEEQKDIVEEEAVS